MSPRVFKCQSGVCTPSSVTSGLVLPSTSGYSMIISGYICITTFRGWTLDQKATLFPANIDENLVDSQYESPFSFKGMSHFKKYESSF